MTTNQMVAMFAEILGKPAVDPRDPDPSRPGIFRDHNCSKCQDGASHA